MGIRLIKRHTVKKNNPKSKPERKKTKTKNQKNPPTILRESSHLGYGGGIHKTSVVMVRKL